MSEDVIPLDYSTDQNGNIVVNGVIPSCRNCVNFVRVATDRDSGMGIVSRRGFCLHMNNGDIGLFVDGTRCDAHTVSAYNLETQNVEILLNTKMNDMYFKMYDRRTKEYKAVKSFCKDMAESSIKDEFVKEASEKLSYVSEALKNDKLPREYGSSLTAMNVNKQAVAAYIRTVAREQIIWLYNRRHMSERNYHRLIAWIQYNLSKQAEKLITEIKLEEEE